MTCVSDSVCGCSRRLAPGIALTASIGVASVETAGDPRALTELPDQRPYEAKGAGRDRMVAI